MKKRTKALRALYADNPWLKDMISSLEAKEHDLESEITNLEDSADYVEELEEKVLCKDRELRTARDNYASLQSRYTVLMDACRKLMQERKDKDDQADSK